MNNSLHQKHFSLVVMVACAVMAVATMMSCGRVKHSLIPWDSTDTEAASGNGPAFATRGPMMTMEGEPADYRRGLKYDTASVTVTVDSSHVNINHRGTYTVTYTATATDGNTTVVDETLRVVGKDEKIIYLTFDDGPSVNTLDILRILRENGVHATFFVTGQFKKFIPLMRQIAEEGHVVAAHSNTHRFSYIYSSIENYFEDLRQINDTIEKYTGKRSHIMRYPGGSSNVMYRKYNKEPNFMDRLCVALLDSGYQFVDWNLDSGDARGNNRPVQSLVASACHTSHPQMTLLMHDTGNKRTTVEALPAIIHYFKTQGYEFGVLNSVDYVCYHGGNDKIARLKRLKGAGANYASQPVQGKVKPIVPAEEAKPADTVKPAEAKPVETKPAPAKPAAKPALHKADSAAKHTKPARIHTADTAEVK